MTGVASAVSQGRICAVDHGHDTGAIQGYLGHRSIVSTQRYTALAPGRFKNFWKE
jgi:site-specific recombinase XerD